MGKQGGWILVGEEKGCAIRWKGLKRGARPPRPEEDHFRARDSAETSSRVNEIAPRDSSPSLGISHQQLQSCVFIPLIARGKA